MNSVGNLPLGYMKLNEVCLCELFASCVLSKKIRCLVVVHFLKYQFLIECSWLRERSKLTKELVYNRKRSIYSLKKYIVGRFRLVVLYYYYYFFWYIQAEEVEAVLANTKQILNQLLRKSRILLLTI